MSAVMSHIILANWKLNPMSFKDAKFLFENIKNTIARLRSVKVIIAPPAVFLYPLSNGYKGNKVEFSAQKISEYEAGAHTGEISAEQFADAGARYALIGHSECGETPDQVRIKTFLSCKHKLTPIIFVGESDRDEQGAYLFEIKKQIKNAISELPKSRIIDIIFCYESVWAFENECELSVYDIHTMILFIRKTLSELCGSEISRKIRIIYAGSVNNGNAASILSIEDLDGIGVGRSGLNMNEFSELLKVANKV